MGTDVDAGVDADVDADVGADIGVDVDVDVGCHASIGVVTDYQSNSTKLAWHRKTPRRRGPPGTIRYMAIVTYSVYAASGIAYSTWLHVLKL